MLLVNVRLISWLHTVEKKKKAVDLICILLQSCLSPSCGLREMRNTAEQ